MFDIAWSELLIIAAIALIVVGPKDLPRLMRTVGGWVAKLRAMAADFQRAFDDMARETELEDLKRELDDLRRQKIEADPGAAERWREGARPDSTRPDSTRPDGASAEAAKPASEAPPEAPLDPDIAAFPRPKILPADAPDTVPDETPERPARGKAAP